MLSPYVSAVLAAASVAGGAMACSPRYFSDASHEGPVAPDPDSLAAAGRAPPVALVYRGPGTCEGCAESLATLLGRAGYQTRYVGPAALQREATFADATLYAQPGGDETMQVFHAIGAAHWPAVAERLRAFVARGGAYLGICLGGFLAGEWLDDGLTIKGLDLLDGDVSAFKHTPTDYHEDQVIPIDWLHPTTRRRHVYFQEGPYFDAAGTVFARYVDGSTAVLLASYGKGKVAVSGVHLEAEADWYQENDLEDPDGPDADLGLALVHELRR